MSLEIINTAFWAVTIGTSKFSFSDGKIPIKEIPLNSEIIMGCSIDSSPMIDFACSWLKVLLDAGEANNKKQKKTLNN